MSCSAQWVSYEVCVLQRNEVLIPRRSPTKVLEAGLEAAQLAGEGALRLGRGRMHTRAVGALSISTPLVRGHDK